MTKARRAVLDLLQKSTVPLSAAAISQSLGDSIDPVTVYRSLHYFEGQGITESFVLHCREHGTERYYTALTARQDADRHWFHCETCHCFIDLGTCGLQNLMADYENERGISIHTHTLYFTGVCAACRQN